MKTPAVSASLVLLTAALGCSSGSPVSPMNGASGGASAGVGGTGSETGGGMSAAGSSNVDPNVPTVSKVACASDANKALPNGLIRRLSRGGYAASMQAALGYSNVVTSELPADPLTADRLDTGASTSVISLPYAQAYLGHAEKAAKAAVTALAAQCVTQDALAVDACISDFIAKTGKQFFRRPLEAAEVTRYATAYQGWKTKYSAAEATELLLRAWAMSPNFLYRTEIGSGAPGEVALTPYELASELSYVYTDAPPDTELMADADSGALMTPDVVVKHAKRLVATPAAHGVLKEFFSQVLSFKEALGQYAQLEPAKQATSLIPSMLKDSLTFVEKVVWEKGGGLEALLTANYSYPDAALATFYGVTQAAPEAEVVTNRAGLFNQAAFLVAVPTYVGRGKTLRTDVLCFPNPLPPAGALEAVKSVDFGYLPPDRHVSASERSAADDTDREHVQKLFAKIPPGCLSCHKGFMPLGLTFEHYDELGAYRETQAGKPLDSTAVIEGFGDLDGMVTDSADLSAKIAKSDLGQLCFAKRFVTFAQGRTPDEVSDGCLISNVRAPLKDPSLSLTEMMLALAQDPGFMRRINAQ